MATKSNVELLITAKDLATQPFGAVTNAIARLTAKLAEQSAAAKTGGATTRELAATLRELDAAGNALIKQANLVELYKKLGEQTEKAGEKASAARAEYERFKATLGADTTAAEQKRLESLGRAADRLEGQLAKAKGRQDARGEQLKELGLDPADLAAAEAALAGVAAEQVKVRAAAQTALDDYDANLRRHKAAVAEAAAAEKAAADQAKKNADQYAAFWTKALDEQEAAAKAAAEAMRALLAADEADAKEAAKIDARAKAEEEAVRAFHEKAAAAAELRRAADYVRFWETELDKAAEAERRSAAASAEWARKTADATARYRAAVSGARTAGGAAKGGPGGFLGLQPYELQNLGYQINDVITQLSSGASLTQTLAQQGGQIFQVFQRQLGSFVAILPRLIAAGAVLGVAVALFSRIAQNAASVRQFTAELRLSADGANYSAAGLVALQRQLEKLGVSFEDTAKGFREFIRSGIRQDQFAVFGEAVANISRTLGIDFPQAAKLAAEAVTGGGDAILRMNDAFNLLSAAQLKAINEAIRSGDVEKARAIAFQAIIDKSQGLARSLDSDLVKALKNAKNAFTDLLDLLANGALGRLAVKTIDLLASGIQNVVNGVRAIVDILPGGGGIGNDPRLVEQALASAQAKLKALQGQEPPLQPGLGAARLGPGAGALPPNPGLARWQEQQNAQIAQQTAIVNALQQRLDALNHTDEKRTANQKEIAAATERQKAADDAYLKSLADQINQHKGLNNAIRVEAAGREAYRAAIDKGLSATAANTARLMVEKEERRKIGEEMRSQAESLESELNSLIAAGGKAQRESLAARLKAIDDQYAIIFKKIEDYARHGGSALNGVPITDLRAQVEQAKEFLKTQETQKFYDENINQLLQARQQKFADLLEDVRDGKKTSSDAYREASEYNSRIGKELETLTAQALEWAKALYAVKPSPQLESFISRQTRNQGNATSASRTAPLGQFNQNAADAGLQHVNEIVQRRNDFEKAYQGLAARGVITQREATAGISRVYSETNDELEMAIQQVERFADALEAAGESSSKIDLIRAKLAEVRAEAKYVDPEVKKLRQTIEDSFANHAVEAIDTVAQSIGQAVIGTKSWGEAFQDAGVAAAKFFAQVLQDIAKEIIAEQAKAAIKAGLKAIGLLHAGGVVGGPSSGGMSRMVSPAAFIGAPRYHDGAIVGLNSDEQAAILQKGEEVLTRDDPRNALNGGKRQGQGGSSGGTRNLKNVVVFDPREVAAAMQSSEGEEVFLTHARRNGAALRSILRG